MKEKLRKNIKNRYSSVVVLREFSSEAPKKESKIQVRVLKTMNLSVK